MELAVETVGNVQVFLDWISWGYVGTLVVLKEVELMSRGVEACEGEKLEELYVGSWVIVLDWIKRSDVRSYSGSNVNSYGFYYYGDFVVILRR